MNCQIMPVGVERSRRQFSHLLLPRSVETSSTYDQADAGRVSYWKRVLLKQDGTWVLSPQLTRAQWCGAARWEAKRASVETGHQNWMPSATPNRPVLWYLFLWRAYHQSFRAVDGNRSEWKKERVWRRKKAWHQSLTKSELLGLAVKIQSK